MTTEKNFDGVLESFTAIELMLDGIELLAKNTDNTKIVKLTEFIKIEIETFKGLI